MQPLQYDLRDPAAQESSITHAAAVPRNLDAAITISFAASRCKPARIYARGNIKGRQSCSHSNAICNHRFKKRIELRTQEQPLVAKYIDGINRVRNDRSHTRRTHEVPFIAACSHFTLYKEKPEGFVLRLPPQNIAHATSMQPFQCDLQPQLQETHRATHTRTTTRCKTHRRSQSRPERPQPHPPHTRGTFHRRLQPLYTLQGKTEGFVLRLPPQNKAHATFMQPLQCILQHSLRRHVTTFLRHHFPWSPIPFVTTSHRHHFPSSPLPFVTTSHRHHFPSSPFPFVTTSQSHHTPLVTFPSSPLPFVTPSQSHHFPSSPLLLLTTSLRHPFPSSPLPLVTTSLCHHFPSSPLPFIAFYSFVMYCDTEPPFIALFFCDVFVM